MFWTIAFNDGNSCQLEIFDIKQLVELDQPVILLSACLWFTLYVFKLVWIFTDKYS